VRGAAEPAQLVRDAVHITHRRLAEGRTGIKGRQRHAVARFHVAAVLEGAQQVFEYQTHRGVGMLLGLVSSIRKEGGEVTFAGVSHHVKSVFELLNLNEYFVFSDSETEVLNRN